MGLFNKIPDEFKVLAMPKEYKKWRTITSRDSGNQYKVNLYKLMCSCPDYLENRLQYGKGDLRRHCKHINRLLSAEGLTENMPPLVKEIIDTGFSFGNGMIGGEIDDELKKYPFLIGYKAGKPWINLFTYDEQGNAKGYGYNLKEKRWSYQKKPPAAESLEEYISKMLV